MHPVLIQFGNITLYTYGLFVGLGFIAASWFSKKIAKKTDVNPDIITDTYFVILVSAIIGARLLYIIINYQSYASNFLSIFKIWEGGLVFYGGFILAFFTTIFYLRSKKVALWKAADIIAPGIALGHAIGRIGCLFAGCCYGKECHLPWAIKFFHPDSLAPVGVYLHPTQIYSIFSNLFIFFVLLFIERKKKFSGMVFLVYLILYSFLRSFLEFFRGDFRGDFIFDFISTSQGIGFLFALLGIILFFILLKKNNGSNQIQ